MDMCVVRENVYVIFYGGALDIFGKNSRSVSIFTVYEDICDIWNWVGLVQYTYM